MRFRLLPLLALCVSSAAVASDLPVPYQHVEYKQTGNVFEWKPLTKTGPGTGGVVFRGDTTISNAEPKISTLARLPYDNRPDSDIPAAQKARVTSPITKANFGKALALAGKIAWPIGVFMYAGGIAEFLIETGLQNIRNTPDGVVADRLQESDRIEYAVSQSSRPLMWAATKSAACAAWASTFTFSVYQGDQTGDTCSLFHTNAQGVVYHQGTWGFSQRQVTSNELEPLTPQQVEEHIAQHPWGPSSAKALADAVNVPGVTIQTEPPTVTGPSSIPGTTTTTTQPTQVTEGTTTEVPAGTPNSQPATKTTTTTNTIKNTYLDNKVTTNTTTTTTTNITNNITNTTNNTTDKEQTTDEAPKDESPPTDTPLGPIPELYTRKYPDGMVGIWNEKKEQLKQSSVSQLVDQLLPKSMTGGSCPRFDLNLNFATWANYGTMAIDYPCWIWTVAKSIIIVSALILARALIFGG